MWIMKRDGRKKTGHEDEGKKHMIKDYHVGK